MEAMTFQRKTRRFPITCSVQYFTLQGAGKGTVVDVSLEGAELRGDLSLQTGALVSLLLYLPDGNGPAKINGASVQWTKDNRFAVKFPAMPQSWKARLIHCCGIPVGNEHLLFEDPTAQVAEAPKTAIPTDVTVFMVHENQNLLELSAGILREEGYTVVHAMDSRAALPVFETYTGHIDLLVVEASISSPPVQKPRHAPVESPHPYPRLHGVELVRWLMNRMTVTRAVIMSATTPQQLRDHGLSIGALPFLPLPFTRGALMQAVRWALHEPPLTAGQLERQADPTCFGRLKKAT